MKLKVFNSDGSEQSESDFDGIPVFEDARGVQALKEVVVAQAANARQGSANTKTRGEVRGGGKKPWRQKGTGRARHGSIRSPIWVGGGVVFGPKPRDYSKKINKKVRLLAYQRALFERAQDGSLLVLDSIEVSPVKTKAAAAVLNAMVAKGRTLLVDTEFAESAVLAFRNLEDVYLGEASHVSVSHLADFANIVVTRRALDLLISRAQGGSK